MLWKTFYRQPQRLWLRKLFFKIHLWLGIGAGLWICLMSVSGAALVFREEMEAQLYARFPSAKTVGAPAKMESIIDNVHAVYAGFNILNIQSPVGSRNSLLVHVSNKRDFRTVFVDPSGRILGEIPKNSLLELMGRFHRD